jgi:hypothetical protein
MRVRSHVGGSGGDNGQSDSHSDNHWIRHGNPFVPKSGGACTNNKCALSEIERRSGRPCEDLCLSEKQLDLRPEASI